MVGPTAPPGHRRLVKCTKCGQLLEDTGAGSVTCHYCGTVITSSEKEKQRETESRERMIRLEVDLRRRIRKHLMWRNLSFGLLGLGIVVGGLVFAVYARGILDNLGSEAPFLAAYAVYILVWLMISVLFARKVIKAKGILSDICR